jgi:hypothetical protein
MGTPAMRSDDALENSDGGPPLFKAVVAGFAAFCAAALAVGVAVGVANGAPPGRASGRAAPGAKAGLAVAGKRGPALPPVSRLCFHGRRGEPVDFPAVLDCP